MPHQKKTKKQWMNKNEDENISKLTSFFNIDVLVLFPELEVQSLRVGLNQQLPFFKIKLYSIHCIVLLFDDPKPTTDTFKLFPAYCLFVSLFWFFSSPKAEWDNWQICQASQKNFSLLFLITFFHNVCEMSYCMEERYWTMRRVQDFIYLIYREIMYQDVKVRSTSSNSARNARLPLLLSTYHGFIHSSNSLCLHSCIHIPSRTYLVFR